MRFTSTLLSVLSVVALTAVNTVASSGGSGGSRPPTPPRLCNPSPNQSNLAEKQSAAIKDFAKIILIDGNATLAYDTYIPGQYIQHNAAVPPPYRNNSLAFLENFYGQPYVSVTNLNAIAGEGYGVLHYKLIVTSGDVLPGNNSVIDIFKFRGTCFYEHWDLFTRITGTEPNPIAYF